MSTRQIIIAERGWVFVGMVAREADHVVIRDAAVVRRWGTTNGIGQLAEHGPQPNTVLDPCPTVHIFALAVVAQIECNETAWAAWAARREGKTR